MAQFIELGGNNYMSGYGVQAHVRPYFMQLFALVLITVALVRMIAFWPSAPTPAITFKPVAQSIASVPSKPTTAPTQPASSPVVQAAVPTKNCVPAGYSLPPQIDLSNASLGLTELMDARQYYQIYGNNPDQIHQQVAACAPHVSNVAGTYAAYTSYTITWQYDYAANGAGVCVVKDARLGLRQNQIFPQWQPAGSAALQQQWQAFMSGLEIHEQGQVALNEQYAQTMLSELQNFPATSCSALSGAVNAQMKSDIAALNAAHQSYEDATNYGAIQGAIVP